MLDLLLTSFREALPECDRMRCNEKATWRAPYGHAMSPYCAEHGSKEPLGVEDAWVKVAARLREAIVEAESEALRPPSIEEEAASEEDAEAFVATKEAEAQRAWVQGLPGVAAIEEVTGCPVEVRLDMGIYKAHVGLMQITADASGLTAEEATISLLRLLAAHLDTLSKKLHGFTKTMTFDLEVRDGDRA